MDMNNRYMQFWDNQYVPVGVVLGLALIIVGIIAAWAAISIKNANDTLTVTGSATANVSADTAVWTVSPTRSAVESAVPQATEGVIADAAKTVAFFKNAGIPADKITVGAVHTDQDYTYSQQPGEPKRYVVRQDVTVAGDPLAIQKLAQDTTKLTNQGIILTTQDPQYYISTLPDYRVSLAGEAVKDAKARAAEIMKNTNQSVGRLRSASTASVQVMAANSINVSDYGTYDTSTIDKTVMVTIRATFGVD